MTVARLWQWFRAAMNKNSRKKKESLASHVPSVSLLPLLKRLLDENLRRYCAFRKEAEATGWHQGKARNEAMTPHTHEYQRAFLAINAPETAALMREYLPDEHFGPLAALVLASQWTAANEPGEGKALRTGVDFSRVEEKRAARATNAARVENVLLHFEKDFDHAAYGPPSEYGRGSFGTVIVLAGLRERDLQKH